MNFTNFKNKYLKVPVVEYPNNRINKKPIVTVRVITYNHVGFIAQCLDSILMQKTSFDFEILIAEDDSNDGTRGVCKQYAERYPDKIRLLLNSRENNIPINNKPSGTFNSVYSNFLIQSKYIALIEGDDYWTDETSLQKRVDFLEENDDHVLCFHNCKIFNENLKTFNKKLKSTFNKSISLTREVALKFVLPTLTFVYKTNVIDIFDENMLEVVSGDTILVGKLANFGKIRYINDIKPAVYRLHNGGIYSTKNYRERKEAIILCDLYLLNYYEQNNWELDFLNERMFSLYMKKTLHDVSYHKKLKINSIKNIIYYFYKSKNKKHCLKTLVKNIQISLRYRLDI